MLKVAVLVSGGGTNLQAILDAADSGKITNTEIRVVISNNEGAYALERAKNYGTEALLLSPKSFETREEFNQKLLEALKERDHLFVEKAVMVFMFTKKHWHAA